MSERDCKIEHDLLLLKWMTGFILAGLSGLIFKAFA